MNDDSSPFFVAPHRFDATEPGLAPRLDRRHELVPEADEKVLWQGRLQVAGHLLGPTDGRRSWLLDRAAQVTVTTHRVGFVHAGPGLALVGGGRSHPDAHRLVSGQVRWQWPSRLELLPAGPGDAGQLLIVCDALRTIQQPAFGLAVPAGSTQRIAELARLVRRAVAGFRLANPALVELSPPERDVLTGRAGIGPFLADSQVTLPGSLPVEFLTQADYYQRPGRWVPPAHRVEPVDPLPRFAVPHRPGSAC